MGSDAALGELFHRKGTLSVQVAVMTRDCMLMQVLQQLDEEGCARVAGVLKRLPHNTVLVVGQADSYVSQTFDAVDCVVKQSGQCTVEEAP